ncbi:MAG: hypothetical protein OYH77_06330, partial [Pseudomonadota bacterium]|nr:hypothetical protein [Pseudomonadota bacterium]
MIMRLLMLLSALSSVSIFADDSGDTLKVLDEKYQAIQRQRDELNDQTPGKITTEVKYRHHHQEGFLPPNQATIDSISNSYIECVQGDLSSDAVYDFPLKVGWLYNGFSEGGDTTKKFFDTGVPEHWALPNVSCNFKNVLAAVSWYRSGKNEAFKKNKGLHSKFKDHKPPFYSGKDYFNSQRRGGVYCDWDGWLYPSSNINYDLFIDTANNDEIFTLLNVYCHRHQYVRMFYSAQPKQGTS